MRIRLSLSLILMSTAIFFADANNRSHVDSQIDSTVQSTRVVVIDGNQSEAEKQQAADSLRNAIATFYYDQFHHSQDPGAPYFLFLSKDANLSMGIGGAVRMRAYYDWGGAMPSSGFTPALIPMHPSPTAMRQLGTTPAGTCLFFRVLGRNKVIGNYQLYIEANFEGYNMRDFHLKKAYAIINDVTVGYAPSTFSDPPAEPPTVDSQGPNNKITPTAVLVRYMPLIKGKWHIGISAETPAHALNVDNVSTAAVSTWMPDFATAFQYEWAQGQHVRLAGIIRTLSYRNLIVDKNYNKPGWGVQLGSIAHPFKQWTTYATVNYGQGHESLGGDLGIGNNDLLPVPGKVGEMYTPGVFGWCVGLQYNFRPNLFMTLIASEAHYFLKKGSSPDEYKRGLFSAVNIFWNITPRMQVGAEFDLGRRENISGEHRYARRMGAVCQFSF